MPPKRVFTLEEKLHFVEEAKKHESLTEAARVLGVERRSLSYWRNGKNRGHHGIESTFTPERRREIAASYRTGDYGTQAECAKHFGCTRKQVNCRASLKVVWLCEVHILVAGVTSSGT